MIKRLTFALLSLCLLPASGAADSPQFRGPDRDGQFSESGLLQTWPDGGPSLLWKTEGLGAGFASLTVVDGMLYTTGMNDDLDGTLSALSVDGTVLWRKGYGKENAGGGYPGTRSTPTWAEGRLHLLTSEGQAITFDAKTGEELWRVDLFERFGGRNIYFGVSESPLVIEGKVIYTPGGTSTLMVALDATDGSTVWTTESDLGDLSAYCNPRLLEAGELRQIVTLTQRHMVGVDPDDGKLMWSYEYPAQYDIHAISPVFDGRRIYVSDGYGQGGRLVEVAADGSAVRDVWKDGELDAHHGGVVLRDGLIYGAASKGSWHAVDLTSGEIRATIRRLGKGAVVHAAGRLYGYTEKGEVVLVDPSPDNFAVVGRFEVTEGEGHHWAHPVIADGTLYVRHGDVLMAYDIGRPD